MLKKCMKCGMEKHGKSFKNTIKTHDGKYPMCKNCEWMQRVASYHHRHNVAHRLYRELVAQIEFQDTGKTHLYMNKTLFSSWLYIHPKFEKLYDQYVKNLGQLDFHLKVKDRSSILNFDNLEFFLNSEVTTPAKLFDPQK